MCWRATSPRCGWGRSGRLSSSAATKERASPGRFPRRECSTSGEREALIALGSRCRGARWKTSSTSGSPLTRRSRPRRGNSRGLTHAAGDAAGAVTSPSEVVLSLRTAVPGAGLAPPAGTSAPTSSARASTAFLQAARLPEGAERRTLECLLEADSVWDGRLRKLRRAAARAGEVPVSEPVSEALFAPVKDERGEPLMRLSPSQVERYFSCPFAYFCRYGLGIRTPVRAELNPLARGASSTSFSAGRWKPKGSTALPPEEVHKLTIRILARVPSTPPSAAGKRRAANSSTTSTGYRRPRKKSSSPSSGSWGSRPSGWQRRRSRSPPGARYSR